MEYGKSSSAAKVVLLLPMVLSWTESQAQSIGYTSDPQHVPFCENQTVPTMFTMACQYNSTIILPTWLVTGLASMSDRTIRPDVTSGPFIPQGRALLDGVGESTLTVNSQEVTAATCFQCVISTIGGSNIKSRQGCVTAVGPPSCTEVVVECTTLTSITVSWTTPAPTLIYRISACLEGTSDCPVQTNCTGCCSYEATGLSPNTNYTITVDSLFSLANGDCFSQGCSANTVTAKTVARCPECLPCDDSASQGAIAGVAVGCLSLSLLFSAASVVITFLCTRRCYNKKSSPPSPNEKSVYYETVQSDSVQMQPSPAYQSVEQLK